MIDIEVLRERWESSELSPWASRLSTQLAAGLSETRYGDLPRWKEALARLPHIDGVSSDLDQDTVSLSTAEPISEATRQQLLSALQGLHPWRKGPFDFFGVHIETEWRSDWKWQRLAPHLADLEGRRVLDVGCGNGYHCWRIRGEGAEEVVGIDPSPLFVVQFQALQHYAGDSSVSVLPVGIEQVPDDLKAFDSVFSMGVLYHRRSPIDHLLALRGCLRIGGELILETLVVEGNETECLVPGGRYARM